MPPLMVRGGVEHSETEGIRKSVFDKVNRNADINPQKGRHLLCTFCPCEKRKQGETSHRRERKETGSQPHRGAPPVSVLYKSFRSPLVKFFLRKNLTKRRCEGRCHEVTEGIRKPDFDSANLKRCHKSAKRASLVMLFLPLRKTETR